MTSPKPTFGGIRPKPAIVAWPAQRQAWVTGGLPPGRYFEDLFGADERQ
jgi:hypothetical protein